MTSYAVIGRKLCSTRAQSMEVIDGGAGVCFCLCHARFSSGVWTLKTDNVIADSYPVTIYVFLG